MLGLAALKNFLEEGFDATAFDKNDYVGGLWHFTENADITSATESLSIKFDVWDCPGS